MCYDGSYLDLSIEQAIGESLSTDCTSIVLTHVILPADNQRPRAFDLTQEDLERYHVSHRDPLTMTIMKILPRVANTSLGT